MDNDKPKPEKSAPWVPIAKDAKRLLPWDRPYSELEALFCLQLDHNDKKQVSLTDYSRSWSWGKDRVKRLFRDLNLSIVYPMDTSKKQNQRGFLKPLEKSVRYQSDISLIQFINFNKLEAEPVRNQSDTSLINAEEPSQASVSEPLISNNNTKEEGRKTSDSRVRVFSSWFAEKFKKRFKREYKITNWKKHGGNIKSLLKALGWEDLLFISIEFLLDEDPFVTEKQGHNVGTLLSQIGKNKYSRYLDADFREANHEHIIPEPKAEADK